MQITKGKLRTRFKNEVAAIVENKVVDFMCGETSGDVTRGAFLQMYRQGSLDARVIELELPDGGGDGGKKIKIPKIITVRFDKNLIKPLELLHLISAVANVSVVTDDEQARSTSEMLSNLSRMSREQIVLSLSGLPLLI